MTKSPEQQHVELLVARGADALTRRDFAEAVNALEAALELNPEHREAARYLKFAQLGARQVGAAASRDDGPMTAKQTLPPGAFKVLKPRKKRTPTGEAPEPLVRLKDDQDP